MHSDAAPTSRAWFAEVGVVAALAASEVILPAALGAAVWQVALLAGAALVFVVSYVIAAAPGKCHYDAVELRPVLGMLGAVLVAIGATGGITGPMLPLLPVPFLVGWMLFHGGRESHLLAALVPVSLIALILVPETPFEHGGALAAWTSVLSLWTIGRRVSVLFETFRTTFGKLDLVRNGALADAESRRRGIESMSTKLAHELKNPLAAIKSLAQLELRAAPNEKTRRRLEVVFSESERMQAILTDYLNLQRPIDEKRVAALDVGDLMAEVVALLAGRAELAGVDLRLHGNGGQIDADRRLVKEAIVNLGSNALLATPRGGAIDMLYQVGLHGASFTIRDTGIGMSKDLCERIGTPFLTTREGGTGLGVAIARSAIAQHDGTLAYSSAPGMGTTVTFTLPTSHRAAA